MIGLSDVEEREGDAYASPSFFRESVSAVMARHEARLPINSYEKCTVKQRCHDVTVR